MDISRAEQRILHLLAQGGRIDLIRDDRRKASEAQCITRDGWRYGGLDLALFRKLKRRGAIASSGGAAYRITRRGLQLVRSQPDNC
ncbi:MAG: YjhX family toxin [Hyphomonas sp.]